MGQLFGRLSEPALPTYKTAAAVLERKNGSGLALAGWTIARTIMIAPPMMLVGVPAKTAFFGAGLASILISTFTLLRIFNAGPGFAGPSQRRRPGYRARR